MAGETDKNFEDRTKKEAVLWWIYLLIGFVASVVIASMGYIFYVGNHMTVVHTPLTCAAMEIKIEVTTAHLWFEEIISGDRDESIDAAWGHLDEADWYAQAMLEGGENPHWKYYPVDDAGVHREIENIQAKLAEFRAITQERFAKPADSPAGSEIYRRYDAVFAELMNAADQVEAEIKQMIGRELRNFHLVQTVLIFICVLLTVLAGIVIGFIHRQIRDKLKLQAANQQLDASNQQLDASNQQLDASNQQLLASQEQQRKLIHKMGERIKELNCLYELSRLNEQSDKTLEEIFQDMVELIPPGWHYSETTCARVVFEDREFKTANFKQTKWKQSTNIKVSGKKAGVVEVYYLKECPTLDEGPFLKEERNLIDGIGRMLSEVIERKKAEEKQVELLEKVNHINKELKDFASIVSHDLKAPLRGIKTLANWILSDCADKIGDQANEQMNLLLERVERMYNLIEGTLQYSRAGRAEGKRVQVNLNNFIPEIINMVVPPENITITIENELPVIECEETHIMQLFQNLLSNAIKYMDKPQGWIKVGCVEQDGFWKFSVADNGPGIEEKHFEKIFKIFQALPTSPDFQGTGVGLTVVKKIVELYDGRIWVESNPGEGSTFFFTMPKSDVLQEVCTEAAS